MKRYSRKPIRFEDDEQLKEKNRNGKIPILARRLTQLGIGFPVNLIQASLQKWLQFLVIKL